MDILLNVPLWPVIKSRACCALQAERILPARIKGQTALWVT